MFESVAMGGALFILAAGFPTAWIATRVQGQIDTGGDAMVSLLLVGLCGFLILQMNGRWQAVFQILAREPFLLSLLFWASMSAVWSENLALSGRRAIAMLVASYFGVHLVLRFTQFEILRLLGGVFAALAALNLFWIVALPQYSGPVGGQSVTDVVGFDSRLTGIYDNPNSLGRVMALATFTMVAAYRLDRRRRPLYAAGLVTAALSLALSQSKTALVVAVLTTLLLVVFLVFRSRKQLFGAVLISVIGSGVVTIALALQNLDILTGYLGRDVTLTGRVPLWKNLIKDFGDHPIAGYGFNGYWNGWGSPSHGIWNKHKWQPPHGHNQFIDMMLTLGIVGVVLFTLLIARTLLRGTRHIRDVPGVFGMWPLVYGCFFLLTTLTESALFSRDIVWCLFVASVVLVSKKGSAVMSEDAARDQPAQSKLSASR